jgi:hypothetical protein
MTILKCHSRERGFTLNGLGLKARPEGFTVNGNPEAVRLVYWVK